MNIFVLDRDIKKCAHFHCDKHVVKMVLEYAQILCTVCNMNGAVTPYRSTHRNHPCVIWARESLENWRWLRSLAHALNAEYKYRYLRKKNHAAYDVITQLVEPNLPSIGLTEFVQAMPECYKVLHDAVQAYRNYYVGEKAVFAEWTRRRMPPWYKIMLMEQNDE